MKPLGVILWIDDDPKRDKFGRDLQNDSGIEVDFCSVKGKNLAKHLPEILERECPSLVIVDHVLDKTAAEGRVFETGVPLAERIREKWPACPVVGVTAAEHMVSIDVRSKYTYDDLYPITDFETAVVRLPIIARDFRRVSQARLRTIDAVVKLFVAPKGDAERLKAALPDDLKRTLGDPSVASRLYAWVDRVFMERPGFLYNRLWAATFMGIKSSAFAKVEKLFESAIYEGVFAFPNKPRWWASRLADILYQRCPPKPGQMPWELGRELPRITRRDYSECAVCGKPYPQTVAYADTSSGEPHPMHLECTEPHPAFKREMFFEEIRIMKQGKKGQK